LQVQLDPARDEASRELRRLGLRQVEAFEVLGAQRIGELELHTSLAPGVPQSQPLGAVARRRPGHAFADAPVQAVSSAMIACPCEERTDLGGVEVDAVDQRLHPFRVVQGRQAQRLDRGGETVDVGGEDLLDLGRERGVMACRGGLGQPALGRVVG
jgi:hypothetical protein